MTAPDSSQVWPIRGTPSRTLDDHLMRIVVVTMNSAVDRLARAATAQQRKTPGTAAHIRELTQAMAGMTLDALRTWPSADE